MSAKTLRMKYRRLLSRWYYEIRASLVREMTISDKIAFALCMGVFYPLSIFAKLLAALSRDYHLWTTPIFSLFRQWHVAYIFVFPIVWQCIFLLGSCSLLGRDTNELDVCVFLFNDFTLRIVFFPVVSSGAADVFCELILNVSRLHWTYLVHVCLGSGSCLRTYSSCGCLFCVGGGNC
jgi:hypothetical protein